MVDNQGSIRGERLVERSGQQRPGARGLLRERQGQHQRTVAAWVGSVAEKLNRAVAEAALLLTSVNVVVQFSSAARCAIEPMKFRPAIEAACCSTSKERPATVKVPERSPPAFAATTKLSDAAARSRGSSVEGDERQGIGRNSMRSPPAQ